MKKMVLCIVLLLTRPVFAEDISTVATPKVEAPSGRRPWLTELRAGFVTSNPDYAVTSDHWKIDPLQSHQVSLGGLRTFPQAWRQWRFFGGSEFLYMTAKLEMSGAYTATIDVTIMEWLALGGVEWRPGFVGANAGFRGATKFVLWGEKTSKLDAENFNQNLGRERTHANQQMFGVPIIFAVTAFYDLNPIQLSINLEGRLKGSALTAGVGYAF